MIKKINILFFAIILFLWGSLILNHNIFYEYDGVLQYYSGVHFLNTLEYKGWASHFWPPLQPLLLALGDPLVIGKAIAFVSGIISLLSIYKISKLLNISHQNSVLLIMLISSSMYFLHAFSIVENHALETAFYLLTVWCYLLFDKTKLYKYIILAGVFCGFAGLSRYTSYSLALSIGLILGFRFNRTDFIAAALFSICFILISSIWWIPNFIMHNNPLATWQYLNIGSGIFSKENDMIWPWKWWWIDQVYYDGVWDLIKEKPVLYFKNIIINFLFSIWLIFTSILSDNVVLGSILGIICIVLCKWKMINKNMFLLLFSSFIYILVASNAFIFKEALLPIIIIIEVVIFYYFTFKYSLIKQYALYFLLCFNMFFSVEGVIKDIKQYKSEGMLKYRKISEDVIIKNKDKEYNIVVSSVPSYGYYSNSDWINLPLWGMNNLCDVIGYNVISDKIYNYAPKSNVVLQKKDLKIDFIIFNKKISKNFKFLDDDLNLNKNDQCFSRVKSIYKTKHINVLKVIK